MMNYVVGFLFSEMRDQVVLIHKRKPDWQAGFLNGVGGKIEEGEPPDVAMAREFREETGAPVPAWSWQQYCTMTFPAGACYFLRAFDTGALLQVRTTEAERVVRADPWALPRHVLPNLRWLIGLALDNDVAGTVAVRLR